jgi:hypothetical protein
MLHERLQCVMNLKNCLVLWLIAVGSQLIAAPIRPDFSKLVSVPAFPATLAYARSHKVPIEGIDPLSEGHQIAPGDLVVDLVTLFEKGQSKSQWLLIVEALEATAKDKAASNAPLVLYIGKGEKVEFDRSKLPALVRLIGPFTEKTGKVPRIEDERSRTQLAPGFLSIGLDQAAATTYRLHRDHFRGRLSARTRPFTEQEKAAAEKDRGGAPLTLAEQRALVGSYLALQSYTEIVQETPGLDGILYRVVKPPSIWSVVWHLGVKITIDLERDYVARTPSTIWGLSADTPCFTYPLTLRINGDPALTTTLITAPPRPPLLECAGIVGMLAENPKEKETYLLLRLLSARHRNSN